MIRCMKKVTAVWTAAILMAAQLCMNGSAEELFTDAAAVYESTDEVSSEEIPDAYDLEETGNLFDDGLEDLQEAGEALSEINDSAEWEEEDTLFSDVEEDTELLTAADGQPTPFIVYGAKLLSEGSLSGITYNNMYECSMDGNGVIYHSQLDFNLYEEYRSVSFLVGYISGQKSNPHVAVMADNVSLLDTEVPYDQPAKRFTLPVSGVKHLQIYISGAGGDAKHYGIADLKFEPAGNVSDHFFTSDPYFDAYNTGLKTHTAVEQNFRMGDGTYDNGYTMRMGYVLNNSAQVGFNFQGHMKTMSFDIGFIKGDLKDNVRLTVQMDGETVIDAMRLPCAEVPQRISLDVAGRSGVVITLKNSAYDTAQYGIGNIELHSDGTPMGVIVSPQKATLTSSAQQVQLNAGVYPSDVDADKRVIHFYSEDESVALVDENGLVTGRFEGTVNIVAESEKSQISGKCAVTSKLPKARYLPSRDGWGFHNASVNFINGFGIDDYYEDVYKRVCGNSAGYAVSDQLLGDSAVLENAWKICNSVDYGWHSLIGWGSAGGLCYGISNSEAYHALGTVPFSGWSGFKSGTPQTPYEVKELSRENGYNKSLDLYLDQYLFGLRMSQMDGTVIVQQWLSSNRYQDLLNAVKNYQNTGKNPIIIRLSMHNAMHEVFPYEVIDCYPDRTELYFSDSNFEKEDANLRHIVFEKDPVTGKIGSWYYADEMYNSGNTTLQYSNVKTSVISNMKSYTAMTKSYKLVKVDGSDFYVNLKNQGSKVLQYINGLFTGDTTQSQVVPIHMSNGSGAGGFDSGLMAVFTNDPITICNTGNSGEVSAVIAGEDHAVIVTGDAGSTIEIAGSGTEEKVTVVPSSGHKVEIRVNHEDDQYLLTGNADIPVTVSYNETSSQISVDGYSSFDLTASVDGGNAKKKTYSNTYAEQYTFNEQGAVVEQKTVREPETSGGGQETVQKPAVPTLTSAKNRDTKTVRLVWKPVTGADGYRIQYAQNSKFTKNSNLKTLKKGTKKRVDILKLAVGKTYYFRIKSFITTDSGRVYSKWSKNLSVQIRK